MKTFGGCFADAGDDGDDGFNFMAVLISWKVNGYLHSRTT